MPYEASCTPGPEYPAVVTYSMGLYEFPLLWAGALVYCGWTTYGFGAAYAAADAVAV